MKILHYALGFPPYRTGGLTKYCIDLMLSQKELGYEVAMMWPGRFSVSGHFVRFKMSKNISGIRSIEVANPLPVSLDEGITDTEMYMQKCPNPEIYAEFLREYKPDAIHLHTLMGLHKEFLEEAKKLGIKIVFTSHDYFGICPKVTLFRNGKVCSGNCRDCAECNTGALSLNKIKLLQSPLYRTLKDSAIVKKLRQRHRQEFFEAAQVVAREEQKESQYIAENDSRQCVTGQSVNQCAADKNTHSYVTEESVKQSAIEKDTQRCATEETVKYEQLRKHYIDMLEMVDIIHFNSSVTEAAYRKYIPETIKGQVINITHKNISDNRKIKKFEGDLKITYLAPPKQFKGWLILKQALDELWAEGCRNLELNIYNEIPQTEPYIKVHPSFAYSELPKIFENTDVLIAPSVWYETYGFTVLEALSFGVPVIVSDNVGAKDLLRNQQYGLVIKPEVNDVKFTIKRLLDSKKELIHFNKAIVSNMNLDEIMKSMEKITELYDK